MFSIAMLTLSAVQISPVAVIAYNELNIPCNALKTFIYVLNSFFCNVFIGYEEMFPNKLCVSSYVYWM